LRPAEVLGLETADLEQQIASLVPVVVGGDDALLRGREAGLAIVLDRDSNALAEIADSLRALNAGLAGDEINHAAALACLVVEPDAFVQVDRPGAVVPPAQLGLAGQARIRVAPQVAGDGADMRREGVSGH
jgi:hypothetical protein